MDNQKVENVNTMISINPAEPIPEPITKLKKRKSSKIFFKVALFMMRGRSKKSKVLPPDDESRSIWRKLVGSMRPMHLQSHRSPPQINNEQNQKMVITENSSNNDNIQSEDGFDSASEFPNSPSPNLPSPTSSRYASTVGLSEMVNSPSTGSSRYTSAVGLSEMANSPSHVSSRYASAVGLSEMAEEEEKENEEEQEEEEKENEEEQEDKEEKEEEEEEEQEDEEEKENEEEEEEEEEKENENEGNVVGDEMIDAKADEFIAQFYQQMKLQRMNIVGRHYKEMSMRSLGI